MTSPPKTVSFSSTPLSTPSSSSTDLKQRRPRPSLKQPSDGQINFPRPPKEPETYTHENALIRRLRLRREGDGDKVDLAKEFNTEVKLVGFIFGQTWRGAIHDTYDTIERFAVRNRHRFKFVYVSVDTDEQKFLSMTRGKPWTAMEWVDGSNDEDPGNPANVAPSEPFLPAGAPDLESFHSTSKPRDPSQYLRPFSRAHLAEHFNVLKVPTLVVYNMELERVVANNVRVKDKLNLKNDEEVRKTLEAWENGIDLGFSLHDLVRSLKWTLIAAFVAAIYVLLLKLGAIDDVAGRLTGAIGRMHVSG